MNKLKCDDSVFFTSATEKGKFIDKLYEAGFKIGPNTYKDRYVCMAYPYVIYCPQPIFEITCKMAPLFNCRRLTVDEFLRLAGIPTNIKPVKNIKEHKMI